jgi:TM2 domain-containing membrane protein YozV
MGDALSKITNNILNLVASTSLLLLVYSLFILREIQPQGYTINIYEQLPFSFYLTLLFCYLSACVLLLAYRKMSAVLILLLVHITVMLIPYMLGYVSVGRGDEFSYMGLTGEGGLSGLSSLSLTGPLFVSALALISGMRPSALSYFLPVFFSIMFICGMFLFYRVFMSREKLVSVAFLSSLIPYFGHFQVSTSPYYLCFCLVPLYLFLMRNALSGKNRAMAICLLLMVPLIPLADPFIFAYLACFSLFLILSMMSLKSGLLHKIMSLNFLSPDSLRFRGPKVPAFIFLSLTAGVFLLYAKYVPHSFDILFPTLAWRTDPLMTTGFFRIPEAESNFFEFIHLFNLHYGKYYIPLIFILINSIIVWQNRKRFCHHFVRRYPRFLAMYLFTFFLELAFLFNPFIPYPPDRFANLSFIIFAQIPLMGYSLYVIFLRKGYTLGLGSAIMILCLLWTLGFFTCFSSPYTGGVSDGLSQNEAEGIHWLSEVRENHPYIISGEGKGISAVPGSLSGNFKSTNFSENSATPVYAPTSDSDVVLHLEGSDENEPFYLVVTTFSKALSLNERKHNGDSASYVNTRSDYNVHKIYDSLNIKIYEHRP